MRSVRVVPVRGRPTMKMGDRPVVSVPGRAAPSFSQFALQISMTCVDQLDVCADVVVRNGSRRVAGHLVVTEGLVPAPEVLQLLPDRVVKEDVLFRRQLRGAKYRPPSARRATRPSPAPGARVGSDCAGASASARAATGRAPSLRRCCRGNAARGEIGLEHARRPAGDHWLAGAAASARSCSPIVENASPAMSR